MRCRPIMCVDATLLKNKFKRTLMAATAINGERCMVNDMVYVLITYWMSSTVSYSLIMVKYLINVFF